VLIRPELPTDRAAIRSVIEAAFADAPHRSGTEAAIVEALRASDALAVSLVAELSGAIIGHVAFSPVVISE
jgi:putative acetyltransferase